DRDQRPVRGQQVGAPQLRQGREDLAVREIAGRAEEHRHVRIRDALESQPLAQRVRVAMDRRLAPLAIAGEPLLADGPRRRRCDGSLGAHSVLTSWPPNSFRSAARTFAPYES